LFFRLKHRQEATRKCGLVAKARDKAFLGYIGLIGLRFQSVGQENPGGEDIPIRLLLVELFIKRDALNFLRILFYQLIIFHAGNYRVQLN